MTNPSADDQIVVVDGSNIATEGRSKPSLAQLNDAVTSYLRDYPDAAVTVVVDATFGHRIDRSEVAEFDEAVANNEVVAPPAGAIGRGDAFVLSIASKVNATVLSNDSFQEFHGDHPWLFKPGRLIGGKPVPNIGWVFVDRSPVKGPVSRKARAEAAPKKRNASKAASEPMPVPTSPPPGLADADGGTKRRRRRPASGEAVNDLLPFLDFVERHPIGSSVTGVVESYSSHGAYVTIGDLRGYVPLRLMGDPAPRSARTVMKLGEATTLVVAAFAPARRSVDLAVPKVGAVEADGDAGGQVESAAAQDGAAKESAGEQQTATEKTPAKKTTSRKTTSKRATARKTSAGENEAPKQTAAKKTPAKKAAAKKSPAKKAAAKKSPAAKTAAKKTPAKRTNAKKTAAQKAPAEQTPGKKAAGRKSSGRSNAATKKTTPAQKPPAKKTTSNRASRK